MIEFLSSRLEKVWKKEEMLVTRIFSPFHIVFKRCLPDRVINPFPNKFWFLCICSTSLLKTVWEKEKLLLTSNFSPFPTVFSTCLKNFLPISFKQVGKTVEKGGNAGIQNFLTFPYCFQEMSSSQGH